MDRLRIFAGSSHPELAKAICQELGVKLSPITVYRYRTGCFEVALEDNVRGCRVFLLQTLLAKEEMLHLHIWELFQMVNAAKKASAKEITVVMPYNGYGRSDKKWRGRMAIAGKLLASLLETAGMDRMVGIDFHSPEFEGFFSETTVVDHLRTLPLAAQYLKTKGLSHNNSLILPGDEGRHKKSEELGRRLGIAVGSVEKTRISDTKVEIRAIQGDVKGKIVIIDDDEICTAGTVRAITEKLEKQKAKAVIISATHGLFQGDALANLSHPLIQEIVVTDTLPIPEKIKENLPLKVLSVAPLLAAAIREIYTEGSVSKLFE